MRFASNMFAGLLLALTVSAANASLMDIRFTAAGAATGFGVLTRDSAVLAANSSTTSTVVPVGVKSLGMARDVGAGNTFFHLADLTRAYVVVSSTKTITDFNFRA